MSKSKKNWRPPPVLEIGQPIWGSTEESHKAHQEFAIKKMVEREKLANDARLDALMRESWYNKAYWEKHGIPIPKEPYPGIEVIRAHTHTT